MRRGVAVVVAGVVACGLALGVPGSSGAVPAGVTSGVPGGVPVVDPVVPEPVVPEPDEPGSCVLGPFAACAGAVLVGRDLRGLDVSGGNFAGADLSGADARGADLTRVSATGASMRGVRLDGAVLVDAGFAGVGLVDASVRSVRGRGLDAPWALLDGSDFAGADLSGGYFGASTARGASFVGADLSGADWSNADLFGADLSGADLTGAVLRGASLRGATLDGSTVLSGADLTGATWTDGTLCGPDSLGTCNRTGTTPSLDSGVEFNPMIIVTVINAAFAIGKAINDCAVNPQTGGNCFGPGDPDAARLQALKDQITALQAEMEAQFAAVNQAILAVISELSQEDLIQRYKQASEQLRLSSIAMTKYQELMACVTVLDGPVTEGRSCMLTDINGENPERWPRDPGASLMPEDLYTGAQGALSSRMAIGGPVARLYFATLWQFGGKRDYAPTNLSQSGRQLLQDMAGTSPEDKDGILLGYMQYLNTRLNAAQGGTAAVTPRFFPGTYLAQVNGITEYLVQAQGAYFAPVTAALALRSTATGSEAEAQVGRQLQGLASKGTEKFPGLSLPGQAATYSLPTDYYGINPSIPVPGPFGSDAADRVAFVVGSDGLVYRIQRKYTGTERSSAYPSFALPRFEQLALLSEAVRYRGGANWSTLQGLYPTMLPPGGAASAWWATFGKGYRAVEILNPNDRVVYKIAYAGVQGPDVFGDNVSYYDERNEWCKVPVRMWDARPSFEQAFVADRTDWDARSSSDPSRQTFVTKKWGEVKYFNVVQDATRNFFAMVTTGAAPSFDLNVPKGGGRLQGTGVLWRCNGDRSALETRVVYAEWVSVTPLETRGLFAKLFPKPVRFESCTALRRADWRGIARPGARDVVSASDESDTPERMSETFRRNAEWYEINRHLDEDGDGIACELSQ